MKIYLLIFLSIILTINVLAQNHSFDTTLVINSKSYRILNSDINDDFVTMTVFCDSKKISIDTIESGGLANIEFPDFNKDNNPDIMLTYMGNNGIYYLYLFDQKAERFKSIDGFSKYPDAIQLKNQPDLYYSYHRAGCADMNWVSDLFKIVDFKTVQLGHIYGQGCDFEVNENPQIIEIYKLIGNNERNGKLIEKLPYLKFIPDFDDKWSFIEKYWNKNYKKFELQIN